MANVWWVGYITDLQKLGGGNRTFARHRRRWKVKGKGKVHPCTGTEALYRPYEPKGGVEVYLHPFLTTALEVGEGSASRPGRSLPPGEDQVPIVQEAGWVTRPV